MNTNIKINCHSSICINDEFYFDPFNITNATHNAKIVFITHSHYDHFDLESIQMVSNEDTLIVGPADVIEKLPSTFANAKAVKIDESADVMGICYKTFPSYNINKPYHPKNKNWVGYILEINNIKYAVCGDCDATPELLNIKCDVLLIPVGGTYTMNYKEAANATNIIKPKLAVPTHYGSIVGNITDGKMFAGLLDKNIECELLIK